MKRMVKKNYKLIIGVVIGLMISSIGVYAVNTLAGNEVSYNHGESGLTSDTVQGAIDELYTKANVQKKRMPKPDNENIVSVYYYNQEQDSEDFCVTGDEDTCKVNTCYLNKTEDSCAPGTIIEYNVKNGEKIRFHVLQDNGEKMMLQSQQNTVDNVAWYTDRDDVSHGPEVALTALENATQDWTNVNSMNYTIGDSDATLGYSGLNGDHQLTATPYELDKQSVNVRMITLQEAQTLGCKNEEKQTCPIWMHNYLVFSTKYGGTVNGSSIGYWTMTTVSWVTKGAYFLSQQGYPVTNFLDTEYAIRAVVEISKQ